jgi:predicted NBD/HSP70 family sugar kinase
MRQLWAGIDAGKTHHHCVVINEDGARLFSKRFANDETEILGILADVLEVAAEYKVTWATDLSQGGAALLIALLAGHGQNLLYIPGRTITKQL